MSSSILFPTNQYTSCSKSSQQIQKLMIPDEIPPQQVLMYLLNKNHQLQMPYVYKNFHKHYKGLISIIVQKASAQQPENQILICQSLKKILLNQKNIPNDDLDKIFLMTLECMNNLNSPANQPLAQILQLLIKVHPCRNSILAKIQTEILQLGRVNQPTISKVTSGRLIAIVSKHIGKMIKGQMIDILKRVLSDNQIEARKVWVGEIFPKLLQGLELDFVELHLQQKIYECVYDENEQIGVMSLRVILKNVTRFSIQEQSSRIVKLFIDSLTSKNQRISLMVTEIMGEVYEKLINVIMKSETNCTRFWRSLVQLAQCKNQKLLNNLIFNLPGILLLSSSFHRTDPLVDIYCELFYQPLANKAILISYFHEISYLYPQKRQQLKQIIYWIFGQLFDDQQEQHDIESIKIMNNFIKNLFKCKQVFLLNESLSKQSKLKQKQKNNSINNFDEISQSSSSSSSSQLQYHINNNNNISNNNNIKNSYINLSQKTLTYNNNNSRLYSNNDNNNSAVSLQQSITPPLFEYQFCEYLFKYLQLLQYHKNSQWLNLYLQSIKQVAEYLPLDWVEKFLLPKLFNSIKTKAGSLQLIIEIMVILLKRDLYNLMNFYTSKIQVEFSKSPKSHQRQAAIQFLYYCSKYFSMDTYQQYKLGEKFLNFSNDKSFQNRFLFIRYFQRIQYFLTREEKIQSAIIISRLLKDSDPEIVQMMNEIDYTEKQHIKQRLVEESKLLKEKEKCYQLYMMQVQPIKSLKPLLVNNRRESKQLKKQEVLKKRIQTTKSKTKMLIKEVPNKRKTPNFGSNASSKISSISKKNS